MELSAIRFARVGALGGLFAGSLAVSIWLVRPLDGGSTQTDAAATVMFFDRIVAGRHLEAFVNSTPKPLLTLVNGGLHAITGDWRAAALLTTVVLASSIVMAAELAHRVAGREAAAFAAVGLVGSAALLIETSWAVGLPWAFALWLAAGLALMRAEPRYGLAGTFLLLAALARPETFLFLGLATLFLGWRLLRGPRPPRAAGLILLGWLAVAVFGIHDYLLTGNPLWWTEVSSISAAAHNPAPVKTVAVLNARHLIALRWLVVLAVAGVVVLVRRRAWLAFWGLAAMGPFVALFTLFLAFRHLAVLGHYLHPIDLAVILSAAIGTGAILAEIRRRASSAFSSIPGRVWSGAAVGSAALLAVVVSVPFAPTSAAAHQSIGTQASFARRIDAVLPVLKDALRDVPAGDIAGPGPYRTPDPAGIILFAPRYQVNRLAATLGLPVTRIWWLEPSHIDLAAGYPPVGSIVYLDGSLNRGNVTEQTAVLRPSGPAITGGVRIVPIQVDVGQQLWIVRIESAQ
jgi:hypothetical protein